MKWPFQPAVRIRDQRGRRSSLVEIAVARQLTLVSHNVRLALKAMTGGLLATCPRGVRRGRALVAQFQLQPGCFPQLNSVEICVQFASPAQVENSGCQAQRAELHCACVVTLGQ